MAPAAGGMLQIEFSQPPNRSIQIESSTDFQNWSLWDITGNRPWYPAAGQQNRTMTGPENGPRMLFRPRFTQP